MRRLRRINNAKIMIVDDEPINIMAVRSIWPGRRLSNLAATGDPEQIMTTLDRKTPTSSCWTS